MKELISYSIKILLAAVVVGLFTACAGNSSHDCRSSTEYFKQALKEENLSTDQLRELQSRAKQKVRGGGYCRGVMLARGLISSRLGQIEQAKSDFKIVLSFNSADTYALYQLGSLYFRQGRLDSAIHEVDRALVLESEGETFINYDPGMVPVFSVQLLDLIYLKSELLVEKRLFDNAKKGFLFCVSEGYKVSYSAGKLAGIYRELGMPDSARYFEKLEK